MAHSRICTIEGCEKPVLVKSLGYCSAHYHRWHRHGDPLAGRETRHRIPKGAICSIPDCDKPVKTRGWCSAHYQRWQAHGDPLGGRPTYHGEPLQWLLDHVSFDGEECLTWPFSRRGRTYGHLKFAGETIDAHRLMCFLAHGAPPSSRHQAAHSCGKGHEACTSPNHLRWALPVENHADMVIHGTRIAGERQWKSALSHDEVRLARALRGKMTGRAIAAMLGVQPMVVSDAQLRKTYRCVP